MTGLRAFRIALWAAVAVLTAAVAGAYVFRQQGLPGVAVSSIGGPFELVDQTGRTVTDAALRGHPSAMFFGYTFCPDVCPTTLFEMTAWMEELGPAADDLKVYFVTVDPERDTPDTLATYLEAFDPRIVGLTGSREQVDGMLAAYRVYSRKVEREDGPYLMDHTATVYLLDEDGALTGTLAYQEDHDSALAKLRRLVGTS